MKRNEIQSSIEQFLQSNAGEFTAQEVLDCMKLQFSVVTVRYHLDYLVMKSKIRSITSSRPAADGRNHKAVVYFK
jgi:predicted ArsR family transcriptional regulator